MIDLKKLIQYSGEMQKALDVIRERTDASPEVCEALGKIGMILKEIEQSLISPREVSDA